MSATLHIHDETGARTAVADLARRAASDNRIVFAHREAEAILVRYPEAGLSVDEVVAMIADACSKATGISVAFGE